MRMDNSIYSRNWATWFLLTALCIERASQTEVYLQSHFSKFAENEVLETNTSAWFHVRSKICCSTICLQSTECVGFQFGLEYNLGVLKRSCDLIVDNITLYRRIYSPGMSIYGSGVFNFEPSSTPEGVKGTSDQPITGSAIDTMSSEIQSTSSANEMETTRSAIEMEATSSANEIDTTSSGIDMGTTTSAEEMGTSGSANEMGTSSSADELQTTSLNEDTTATQTTALPPVGPCAVDAAYTTLYNIVLFSGQWVYFYNSTLKLMEGPYQSLPITSYLPGWTGDVDAAYLDSTSTFLYLIQGTAVKTYKYSDLSHQATETTSQHFSTIIDFPTEIDGVIIFNGELILIDDDFAKTSSQSVQLSVSDPGNPFDAITATYGPPSGVTAVTLTRYYTPLFFVAGQIYHYTPNISGSKGLWDILGNVVC